MNPQYRADSGGRVHSWLQRRKSGLAGVSNRASPVRQFRRWMCWIPALMLVSGCGNVPSGDLNLSQLGSGLGAEPSAIQRRQNETDVELILDPVPVWDEVGVSPPKTFSVDGTDVSSRLREKKFLERPFARAGLFWHSRQDHAFLPLVVLGPPVTIKKVEAETQHKKALLRKARGFQFTPAKTGLDGKISSAAFEIKLGILEALATAETAHLIVHTNRGIMRLGLDVVVEASDDALRNNARVLFARFAEQMSDYRKENPKAQ